MDKYEFYDETKPYILNHKIIDDIPDSVNLKLLSIFIKTKIDDFREKSVTNIRIIKIDSYWNYSISKEFFNYKENNSDLIANSEVYTRTLDIVFRCDENRFEYTCLYNEFLEVPKIKLSESEMDVVIKFDYTDYPEDRILNEIKSIIYRNFRLGYTWKLKEIIHDPNRWKLSVIPQKCYNVIFENSAGETKEFQLI